MWELGVCQQLRSEAPHDPASGKLGEAGSYHTAASRPRPSLTDGHWGRHRPHMGGGLQIFKSTVCCLVSPEGNADKEGQDQNWQKALRMEVPFPHPPHRRGSGWPPGCQGAVSKSGRLPQAGGGHSEDVRGHQMLWQAVRFSEEDFSSPSLLATLVLKPRPLGLAVYSRACSLVLGGAGQPSCPLPAEACVTPSWLTTPPPALPRVPESEPALQGSKAVFSYSEKSAAHQHLFFLKIKFVHRCPKEP